MSVAKLQNEIKTLKPKVTGKGLPPVQAKDFTGDYRWTTSLSRQKSWMMTPYWSWESGRSRCVPSIYVGTEYATFSTHNKGKADKTLSFIPWLFLLKVGIRGTHSPIAQHANRAARQSVSVTVLSANGEETNPCRI